MKKLIYLILFLAGGMLYGQSITDEGGSVSFNTSEDTIKIPKDICGPLVIVADSVLILQQNVPLHKYRDVDYAVMIVDPSNYGYTSDWQLLRELDAMFKGSYRMRYGYDASDNVDTIFYCSPYDSDTMSIRVQTWDGTNLQQVTEMQAW